MPAAEVETELDTEVASYELAFHVLPTVAEGEVTGVFDKIKTLVSSHGGTISTEEAPERFDLAYEVVKRIEGKNRKFTSAYFGWVRFTALPDKVDELTSEIDQRGEILRHLLVRLTREEDAAPFYFHEALASQKMVTDVVEEEVKVAEPTESGENKEETTEQSEDSAESTDATAEEKKED